MRELLYAFARYEKQEKPKWIIWGAGYRGRLLLQYIKKIELSEVYFADNDVEKIGKVIEGIVCLSRHEVQEMANDSIILVSPQKSTDLYRDLRDSCPHVISDIILEILDYWPKANGFEYIMPLGHYYSQYPDMNDIEKRQDVLYQIDREVRDIDFNLEMQYGLLEKMKKLLPSVPEWCLASDNIGSKYRYRRDATAFTLPDAICLHLMLRILQPKKIIEVGSGWSSAVTLDTNEFYMDNALQISFIEPYPFTLNHILKGDERYELKECGLQEIKFEYFEQLENGDILFIDSTHVSKIGSDVNYLLFEIMPRLKKGVYVHFHDIFYPFEYPYTWIKKEGYIWNELYMLRSFLINNEKYKMIFFFDYISKMHAGKMKECLCMDNVSGGSFWMQKV